MNPAKRRRLDATATTLSKPFRSPLKVISNHQGAISDAKNDHADNQATATCKPSPTTATPTKLPNSKSATRSDEQLDITALQRGYAALSQQLRKLRQDLDVVEQAHKIQSTGQGGKLDDLVLKWREIARDAADEVFESARNRVKDIGGLQAWQKNSMVNLSQDRFRDWYDNKQEQPSSDAVDDSRGNAIDCQVQVETWAANEEEKEEKPFTIDVMLQQLKIDPDLLGFDTKNEQ